MKKIRHLIIGLPVLLVAVLGILSGCQQERTVYDGPNYIMFADTLYIMPVREGDPWFEIPVVATRIVDYDRNVGIDIVDRVSDAIEGKNYDLESSTITIPAGENTAYVRVKGYYDSIGVDDEPEFSLKLVVDPEEIWDTYGDQTAVVLYKVCPFDINAFTGWALVQSSWMSSYMSVSRRLVRSELDPDEENGIIIHDLFYDGFDMKIRLTTDDDLNPLTETDDQIFASTAEAFGTTYGDGYIRCYQATSYTSYYSTCEDFIFQYMTLYVSDYPYEGYSTVVGTYYNLIRWISDDEAETWRQAGY